MILTLWLVVFVTLLGLVAWRTWKVFTPRGCVFYFGVWCCMLLAGVCAIKSTRPSSAPRRQMSGIITKLNTLGSGRSKTYTLTLAEADGTTTSFLASAMPPFFAEGRDLVRVKYLDEKVAGSYPRAIAFVVLTGPRAGDGDSVSADWLGPWLGVLFWPVMSFFSIMKAYANKRPKRETLEPSLSILK